MRGARRHTVVHAIAQARLARAMSVLESTDYRIETVAARAGYTGRHVMTAAFREHLHTTPHAYRHFGLPVPHQVMGIDQEGLVDRPVEEGDG